MARYYLDTEFNDFGGELISLALVREDGFSLYLVYPEPVVVPILGNVPNPFPGHAQQFSANDVAEKLPQQLLMQYFQGDHQPEIVTDWPDDVSYFCRAIMTGPGEMIGIPSLKFLMVRKNAYPTALPGAIQHNAYWDARALRYMFQVT